MQRGPLRSQNILDLTREGRRFDFQSEVKEPLLSNIVPDPTSRWSVNLPMFKGFELAR